MDPLLSMTKQTDKGRLSMGSPPGAMAVRDRQTIQQSAPGSGGTQQYRSSGSKVALVA